MTEHSKSDVVVMDTPAGRVVVPAATHRLHGADRSGLGEKGWAEIPDDQIGHPDAGNVGPEYYEPLYERTVVRRS